MSNPEPPFVHVTSLALLTGLCSCAWSPKPMQVPPELASASERYAVSGQIQTFRSKVSFGPYSTARVKLNAQTGVDSGATILNGQKERSTSRQAVEFELPTPSGVKFRGRCVQEHASELQHETTLVIQKGGAHSEDAVVGARHHHSFQCVIESAGATTVKLTVEGGSIPVVHGPDPELVLTRVNYADGAPEEDHRSGSFGYLLSEDGQLVAALDLSEHLESVTLRRDLPQAKRDGLAAICMALLMRRDLR